MDGTVLEYGSAEPVQGATVTLEQYKRNYKGNHSREIVSSTTTDASGKYKMTIRKKPFTYYEIYVKSPTHNFVPVPRPSVTLKNMTNDFYLYPYAYVRVRVIKTSSGEWKKISLSLKNKSVTVKLFYPTDTILPTVYPMYGNKQNGISGYKCFTPSNDIETCTYFEDSFYLSKGDTIVRTFYIDQP